MDTCLIVGASVASSLSAYVLAPFFRKIVILESDSNLGQYRGSLQQGTQFHIFMAKGQATLKDLIPNIEEDFARENCPVATAPKEVYWGINDEVMSRSDEVLADLFLMDRMALERILLERLKDHDNIEIRSGFRVQDLIYQDGRVTGVKGRCDGKLEQLDGDLVMVGGGRNFPLAKILEDKGLKVPKENFVPAEFMYLSQIRQLNGDHKLPWKIRYEQAMPPENLQGAVIGKVAEPNHYMFMMGAMKGGFPKLGSEMEFINNLKEPQFKWFYENSTAVTEAKAYRIDGSHHRPYGQMNQKWPKGLVALGDAVCAFNPVYGQGLTVATLGAKQLKTFMNSEGCLNNTHKFQSAIDALIKTPWMMGTLEDRKLYGHKLSAPERIVSSYMNRLLAASIHDKVVSLAFQKVIHMLKEPTSLFAPHIAIRVLLKNMFKAN